MSTAPALAHRAGVSVVVPAYRGAEALAGTLGSLAAQTLHPDRFEVVVVVNGPAASDRPSFELLRDHFAPLAMRIVTTTSPGASFAWNVGVQSAQMEWLTFVDDDDAVTPTFLDALLDVAVPGVIPLTEIHDVYPDGTIDDTTSLNQRIRNAAGTTIPANRLPQGLGFNASKLVSTTWAKTCRYNTSMSNGQDVAYFGSLSLRHDITFAVPATSSEAAYLRCLSDSSMSRQQMGYDFSIEQRLDVIETLDRARRGTRRDRRGVADHLVESQVHLMNQFLHTQPNRRAEALGSIRRRELSAFPYPALNHGLSTRLAVVGAGAWEWAEILPWAMASGEPFDVLVASDDELRGNPWRSSAVAPELAELVGRLIRIGPDPGQPDRSSRDVVATAVNALDAVHGQAFPYSEVLSSRRTIANVIGAEISRRHPAVRHTTFGWRMRPWDSLADRWRRRR